MNTTRADAFDPKLQDPYRLQQALTLIQYQDEVIAQNATHVRELNAHLKDVMNSQRDAAALVHDALKKLSRYQGQVW